MLAEGSGETAGGGSGRRFRVLSALGVGQILAWGSSYYLPAVLGHPISDSTGWSYAWVTGGGALLIQAYGASTTLAVLVGMEP